MTDLSDLLTHLAAEPADGRFQNYQFTRIGGGFNNLLYHAQSPQADLAVKFTIRDERHRARREYKALLALQQIGLNIAPKPILLDEQRYAQPVVVQSWEAGKVTAVPPQTDDEWVQLIELYAKMATVTPDKVEVELETAVINSDSTITLHQLIQAQLASFPKTYHPQSLKEILKKLPPTTHYSHPIALCHIDPNTLNLIRRPTYWLAVDWENSGWGDPAFDIIDMMSHPRFLDITYERWQWVAQLYQEMTGDETAVSRINSNYPFMLIGWLVRLARARYEIPLGLDERLVKRPSDWLDKNKALYNNYLQRAEKILT